MECHGSGEHHCCWIKGKLCQYLELDTVTGRHWACGLRRELGNWKAVHESKRYIQDILPNGHGLCGDWPQPEVMEKGIGLCCYGDSNQPQT